MEENRKNPDEKLTLFKFVVIPFLFLVVVFHPLSEYLFPTKLWGIHHLCFFPLPFGIVLTLFALLAFVPKINSFLLGGFEKIANSIQLWLSKINRSALYIIISFLSLFIFWAFRTRLHLLGDGYQKLNNLPEQKIWVADWLTDFIHLKLYNFLSSRIEWWNADLTYSSISVLCGGFFVLLVLFLLDHLGKTNFEKLFIGALIFSLGTLELFFGYLESYTMFTLVLALYVFVSILYLKGRVSLFLPFLILIIDFYLHSFGLIFVPTFLYLMWRDLKKGGGFKLGLIHLVMVLVLVFFAFLRIQMLYNIPGVMKTSLILPLFANPTSQFTMFSWDHILEFLNQLLLDSPVGIVLFLLFFWDVFALKDRVLNFLFLGALISITFIFVFNSALGTADWDLRSFPALFYVPLGAILFLRSAKRWKGFKNFSLLLILVSFFHFVPWILLHTDEQRSIEHYKLIQLSDPHPQDEFHYNTFKIARMFEWGGMYEQSEEIYQQAIRDDPEDVRNFYNLAKLYFDRFQKYPTAESLLIKVVTKEPKYFWAYFLLGKIYQIWGELDRASAFYFRSMPVLFDNIKFIKNLSAIYQELGKLEEFKLYLENVARSNPRMMEAHRNLGYVYFLSGDYENARKEWETALSLSPYDSYCREALASLREMVE